MSMYYFCTKKKLQTLKGNNNTQFFDKSYGAPN